MPRDVGLLLFDCLEDTRTMAVVGRGKQGGQFQGPLFAFSTIIPLTPWVVNNMGILPGTKYV